MKRRTYYPPPSPPAAGDALDRAGHVPRCAEIKITRRRATIIARLGRHDTSSPRTTKNCRAPLTFWLVQHRHQAVKRRRGAGRRRRGAGRPHGQERVHGHRRRRRGAVRVVRPVERPPERHLRTADAPERSQLRCTTTSRAPPAPSRLGTAFVRWSKVLEVRKVLKVNKMEACFETLVRNSQFVFLLVVVGVIA